MKIPPNYDFCGWASKNDLLCSDGRTIRRDAFKEDDGRQVPLVWNHRHESPENVLGHALLVNKPEGMYTYGYLNKTGKADIAKELLMHGDITAMSILANKLKQRGADVMHGVIREVSLVLAGANPGAFIDSVMVHGDCDDGYAVIFTGEEIELAHADEKQDEKKEEKSDKGKSEEEKTVGEVFDSLNEEQKTVVYALIGQALSGETADEEDEEKPIEHADGADEKTVQDVFDTLTEEQKTVVYALIGKALESREDNNEEENDNEEEPTEMKHNVFDKSTENNEETLSHSEVTAIIGDIKRYGSLRESLAQHGIDSVDMLQHDGTTPAYGIDPIDILYPDAKAVRATPDFISRDMGWVSKLLGGVHNTAFSRIKSIHANITEDEARAKGYIKGRLKKEEVFTLLRRTTTPTTVYKKQKLDRDDILDITDFDVIGLIRGEMRVMLNEEIARAILVGDGRISSDEDKISETNIRPIATDADLYNIKVHITKGADDDNTAKAFIRGIIKARKHYKGTGNPILFTTEDMLTNMLLLQDLNGRDIYDSEEKLARKLRVREIVTVPVMEGMEINDEELAGIIVNPVDYAKGADRGGAINMFEDFDIDYNQQKYLLETRCSGALTVPFSAMTVTLREAAVTPPSGGNNGDDEEEIINEPGGNGGT